MKKILIAIGVIICSFSYAQVPHIENGESGLSSRNKINRDFDTIPIIVAAFNQTISDSTDYLQSQVDTLPNRTELADTALSIRSDFPSATYDRDSAYQYEIDSSLIRRDELADTAQNGRDYTDQQIQNFSDTLPRGAGDQMTESQINDTAKIYIERNFNDTLLFDYNTIAFDRNTLTENITLVADATNAKRISLTTGQTIGGSGGYTMNVQSPIKRSSSADTIDRAQNVVTLWILSKQDLWYTFSVIRYDTADLLAPTIDSIWLVPFGGDTSIIYMLSSEILNSDSIPLVGAISVTTTGSQTLSTLSVVADTVKLDFDSNFSSEDTIVIAYTLPDSAGFEDLAENKLATFSNDTVYNSLSVSDIPTDGLVGYWSFDGDANDDSGNGHDGVVDGATLAVGKDGLPNTAYAFVNDTITVADDNDFDFGTGDFTLSFWVYRNVTGAYHTVCVKNVYTDVFEYRLTNGNIQQLLIGPSNTASGTATINATTWYHICAVRTSGSVQLWIDGSTDGSPASNTATMTNAQPMLFGTRSNATNPFNGRLDIIRIYNRALSSDEIGQLANE